MEQMEKEIVVTQENSPANMIIQAVKSGTDLDKVEKLLELQMRWEANEAKKAYHKAMAEFKANAPDIDKDKKVSYGNTNYKHASLANVVKIINAELSKYGLSASWKTKQNGVIEVTCKITHVLGHSEETSLSAAADNTGSKNGIQAIGSTITYLERYTILALTGLATCEQDDDAQTEITYINDKQKGQILDIINEYKINSKKFLEVMKAESVDKIVSIDFDKAMELLNRITKKETK